MTEHPTGTDRPGTQPPLGAQRPGVQPPPGTGQSGAEDLPGAGPAGTGPPGTARHLRGRSTGEPPETVRVSPEQAGWDYSGLTVIELAAGGRYLRAASEDEIVVLPLAGSCTVEAGAPASPAGPLGPAGLAELAGRPDVFTAVTDYAYVPRDSDLTIASPAGGRFALAAARARRRLPFRHVPAAAVPVELRGAGNCSRQVNNFAMPGVLAADRLIACEVLTPAGNWSSYPPHKHDQARPGETELEEIYYYELTPDAGQRGSSGPGGTASGLAYQRVYGTAERPADLLAQVRGGDVVLIPHGWHGPSMAAPGYHLYYLNVMAGPGAREWRACDDPAHAWVRGTWAGQPPDPRLPLSGAGRPPSAEVTA